MSNPQQYPPPQPEPGYQPQYVAQTPSKPKAHWSAKVALILGIVGVLFSWIPLLGIPALIGAVLGIVFACIGFKGSKPMPAVALVLCVLGFIFGIVSIRSAAEAFGPDTATAVGAGAAPGDAAPAAKTEFAGGETADVEGMQITVSGVKKVRGTFGPLVCSDVTIVNNSSDQESYNSLDWKLQNPEGQILTAWPSGNKDLGSGALKPGGGKVSGQVCADDPGGKGEWATLYQPGLGSGEVARWRSKL